MAHWRAKQGAALHWTPAPVPASTHPPGKAPLASSEPPTEETGAMASGQSISLVLYGATPVEGASILSALSPAARSSHGPCAPQAATHESAQAAPPADTPKYRMLPRVR